MIVTLNHILLEYHKNQRSITYFNWKIVLIHEQKKIDTVLKLTIQKEILKNKHSLFSRNKYTHILLYNSTEIVS